MGIIQKPETLNPTYQAVLTAVSNSMFQTHLPFPEGTDWQKLRAECRMQAVIELGYRSAKAAGAPAEILDAWKIDVINAACQNLRVVHEHHELHQLMRAENIPYVVLKGCASSMYYPAPQSRVMGDVDFLVRKEDVERTGKALERAGFAPWQEEHICHIVYRKPPAHYEMHFEPAGIPYGKAGEMAREYLADVMEQAREVELEGGAIMCPSPFHHGLILLLHTSHHLIGEGVGLRHLCDWAAFAASVRDDEFRALFEEKLKAMGLWRFAAILTRTTERWIGAPHREWPGDVDDEITMAIIREVLQGGNFGKKDRKRSHEAALISNRGKDGIGHSSMLYELIRSLNQVVYAHWPIARKLPIVLPAGWAYYIGRYVVRAAKKQRPPLQLKRTFANARKRRNVYKEFRLFETENEHARQ